jgi:uncharacterized alpha-E superfamily protein
MLSRVADSLYWMARYLERAEHTARVVSVSMNQTLDHTADGSAGEWGRLVASLPAPPAANGKPVGEAGDAGTTEAIAASVAAARENARQVREQISSEMWEELNRLFLRVRHTSTNAGWSANAHEYFTSVLAGVHLFQGITDATMTHGEGWQYIQVGRFIERASSTAALLAAHFEGLDGQPEQPDEVGAFLEWMGLLKSACAFEGYCRHYTADLQSTRIVEFLLLNADFPRSIRFAAGRVESALKSAARHSGRGSGRAERLAGRMRAALDFGQVDEIMAGGLHAYLASIVRQCAEIHGAIYQTYITYPIEASLSS